MEEKRQAEEYIMNENDEKFFVSMQQCLRQELPEPPAQVDSFIKAAARQQLKKRKELQNKKFIFWSCGVAAAFAVSLSILYFTALQPVPVTDGSAELVKNTPATPAVRTTGVAQNNKESDSQEPEWADVFTELTALSSEINEADMDVSFVSTYASFEIGK